WNPLNQTAQAQLRHIERAARTMGLVTHAIEIRRGEDLDQAFKAIIAMRVRGLIVTVDNVTVTEAARIGELATKHRLAASHAYREFADSGGLMSYGFSLPGLFQATVGYADKILRGARPIDLPMEQPVRHEFVINLKTARTLNLKIPASVIGRADHA